jgi:hypothetical protein
MRLVAAMAVFFVVVVSAGCHGGREPTPASYRHTTTRQRKPVFPFTGVSLTNEDLENHEMSGTIDQPMPGTPLQPTPVMHLMMARAPMNAIDDVQIVNFTLQIGMDQSGPHTHTFTAGDMMSGGLYIREVNLHCDGHMGQPYHLRGELIVYFDPMDNTRVRVVPIDFVM